MAEQVAAQARPHTAKGLATRAVIAWQADTVIGRRQQPALQGGMLLTQARRDPASLEAALGAMLAYIESFATASGSQL
jgi:hypothetical protein